MTFLDDFEKWWREIGQFIPPCDSVAVEFREMFYKFTKQIHAIAREEDDRGISDLEDECEKSDCQIRNLKLEIEQLKTQQNESKKEAVIECSDNTATPSQRKG